MSAMPPHTTAQALLAEIEAFLKRQKGRISEGTFGTQAVNDGKFVHRIRKGGRVWPETAQKVRDFMAGYTGPKKPGRPKAAAKRRNGKP
jgi:hypothetical protein